MARALLLIRHRIKHQNKETMKTFIFLAISLFSITFLGSCVDNSQKYKALQAKIDSLQTISNGQSDEMDKLLADLNDISAGMQSIREAEHILAIESQSDTKSSKSKSQITALKNDVQALSNAIAGYKEKIAKLEKTNKRQSAEFKKLIAGLNEELALRDQKINEINLILAAKEKELGIKTQQIAELNQNVSNLQEESIAQKETIANQDKSLNTIHYLLGSRKGLKEANVISRQGIFCPPIVSSQAQNAEFVDADMRELTSIPLNSKKAKILSIHPSESYTLETGDDGMQTLKINDPSTF